MNGISIVIPTYKRNDYLERLLKSISNQTYKQYEVIIVDDNSPNKEEYYKLIDAYQEIFKDLTFISNDQNKGAPYCRNIGIRKAKYDLIALVDDDDEWYENKLEKQIDKFNREEVGIVYTWTDAVNENKQIVYKYRSNKKGKALKELIKECFMPSPSIMVKKKAIIEAGLFDEEFPSCQDWDMWTRIMALGYECDVVKEVLTIYHKHNRSSIGTSNKAKLGYRMFYKKHIKLYFKYFLISKDIEVLVHAIRVGYLK